MGLTEKAAKDQGYEVKVGRFPYVGNGKAIALGETEGMVKTVFDARTGELLGAHMIGAEVTELIHGYVLARQVEATELDLMHTIYPHPTLSEIYAIGDVVGAPWLAHKASHEGVVCVERIKGLNTVHPLDVTKVPGCTYCTPQVASVGLTEKAAKDKGYDVKIGVFPTSATARPSRSARRRAWSRPCSTRGPASCSAPT